MHRTIVNPQVCSMQIVFVIFSLQTASFQIACFSSLHAMPHEALNPWCGEYHFPCSIIPNHESVPSWELKYIQLYISLSNQLGTWHSLFPFDCLWKMAGIFLIFNGLGLMLVSFPQGLAPWLTIPSIGFHISLEMEDVLRLSKSTSDLSKGVHRLFLRQEFITWNFWEGCR